MMADPLPPERIAAEENAKLRAEVTRLRAELQEERDDRRAVASLNVDEYERLRAQRDALVEKVLAIPVRIEHEWRGITEPDVVRVSVVDWNRLCDARNAAIRAARGEKENTDG